MKRLKKICKWSYVICNVIVFFTGILLKEKVATILCSSGMFRSLEWQLVTDVLGQPIGPVFKNQAVTGGS
jgi:hypothetical protein